MAERVVITGVGVVAPNGVGKADFLTALRQGKSGIKFWSELAELKFGCQVGGIPPIPEGMKESYFDPITLRNLLSSGLVYGTIAGMDAWQDAGLAVPESEEEPDWDSGCVMGGGLTAAEIARHGAYLVDEGKVKKLGSRAVEQGMASGPSAYLGGKLGLGNQVSSNAAACATGTEAVILGTNRIKFGQAQRMLVGGCDSSGPYVWSGFDAMRVLNRRSNDQPQLASRPMSETAKGFVPGGGAGALVLESLTTAKERQATIYAEVLGGHVNSGGQRGRGSMTAPNPLGMLRCIQGALKVARVEGKEVDAISGHLTATMGDAQEVATWVKALDRSGSHFPFIHSLKSMTGHCLSAAGAIEAVAIALQLKHQFLHASINCEDLHPQIAAQIDPTCVPQTAIDHQITHFAKASFGFGDVNAALIFKKWEEA